MKARALASRSATLSRSFAEKRLNPMSSIHFVESISEGDVTNSGLSPLSSRSWPHLDERFGTPQLIGTVCRRVNHDPLIVLAHVEHWTSHAVVDSGLLHSKDQSADFAMHLGLGRKYCSVDRQAIEDDEAWMTDRLGQDVTVKGVKQNIQLRKDFIAILH